MSNYTSNYRLKLPDSSEYFNIEDFNGNSRTIDKALGNCITKEAFADCVKSVVDCMYPHDYEPKIIKLTFDKDFYEEIEGSGMYYYDIPKEDFDPNTDGFFVWINDSELLPKDSYFVGRRKYGYISFGFANFTHHNIMDNGDTVTLLIYKNHKCTGSGTIGQAFSYVSEAVTQSRVGTARKIVDLLDGYDVKAYDFNSGTVKGFEIDIDDAVVLNSEKITIYAVYCENGVAIKLNGSVQSWSEGDDNSKVIINSVYGKTPPMEFEVGDGAIGINIRFLRLTSDFDINNLSEFYIVLE